MNSQDFYDCGSCGRSSYLLFTISLGFQRHLAILQRVCPSGRHSPRAGVFCVRSTASRATAWRIGRSTVTRRTLPAPTWHNSGTSSAPACAVGARNSRALRASSGRSPCSRYRTARSRCRRTSRFRLFLDSRKGRRMSNVREFIGVNLLRIRMKRLV